MNKIEMKCTPNMSNKQKTFYAQTLSLLEVLHPFSSTQQTDVLYTVCIFSIVSSYKPCGSLSVFLLLVCVKTPLLLNMSYITTSDSWITVNTESWASHSTWSTAAVPEPEVTAQAFKLFVGWVAEETNLTTGMLQGNDASTLNNHMWMADITANKMLSMFKIMLSNYMKRHLPTQNIRMRQLGYY